MIDGLVDFSLFLEYASQVVTRNSVQRIKLHGGEKLGARFIGTAHLIKRHTQIDVRIDPLGREIEHLPVFFDRLRQKLWSSLAFQCALEQLLGRRPRHRMEFDRPRRQVEREHPLLLQRTKRARGARWNHHQVAALFKKAQFVERKLGAAELLPDQIDRTANAASRDSIIRQPLQRPQGDEIAKVIESLPPTGLGTHQLEPFPIAKTARVHSQNAPNLSSGISLHQAEDSSVQPIPRKIMHPLSIVVTPGLRKVLLRYISAITIRRHLAAL